jgi:hypothetical protein
MMSIGRNKGIDEKLKREIQRVLERREIIIDDNEGYDEYNNRFIDNNKEKEIEI